MGFGCREGEEKCEESDQRCRGSSCTPSEFSAGAVVHAAQRFYLSCVLTWHII